ncbi:uncharacterized protein EV422DRAFT_248454 [Fimicolochytrium jonesii]|uniref:uncharacterized protein n=1 Tax=Fimicolochytrium jonesii TaxID=1396493 RepID=UPI0022FF2F22|nr:uncharacterized protein EV422DRAFT_248454 [Fimicolochytrium jonesii]KAI8825165.1 hypothetical protein EV422DRAFT_248454 [Fimicolochytrium jonesii]
MSLTLCYRLVPYETGGNQREIARAKAAKKADGKGGQRKDDMTHAQRMEYDKKMIQEKQAAKAAAAAAAAAGGGAGTDAKKK